MLVGPSKFLKQIIQIELNRVKYPSWPKANQSAINKRGREFELGTTLNKSRAGLELGASELQVRRSNNSATDAASYQQLMA